MTKLKLMLVIKSVKDIKSVSIRNEMNVYVSVMIRDGKATIKDTAKTLVVYCAYRNLRWDHEVEFSLDEKLVQEGRLTLIVKIIGVRPLFGDKGVGEVVVSIQALFRLNPPSPQLTSGDNDKGMSLMTREVTGPSRGKGTISFTYRFLAEQAPQPFIIYPVHGTSGYAVVHAGGNAGPSIGQLPIYMPSQYHQSQPQLRPLKPQSQIQPLLHTQSRSHDSHLYQHYSPPQEQLQPQPLPHLLSTTQQPRQSEPQTQGEKPARKPQGGSIAALGLGAAIAGRVIGGALMGEMMSDEVNMYGVEEASSVGLI